MERTTTSTAMAAFMALAGCVTLALPTQAQAADETPWLIRVRAVQLDSANKDSTGLGLSINNKTIPDFDVSYFFTSNWAAELLLTVPQKQTIRANGTTIGSLKHLPPTLTLQYHFTNLGAFKPYVGAGVNYTRFSSVSFNPAVTAALKPSLEHDSLGFAVQAGVDYEVAKNIYLNFDVKKVQIRTDVLSAGAKAGQFRVDPWLVGVGVGWRF